ncbi:MAG: histidine phosphatase family protein [Clostridia bacterium]|nr:histidine phosphatase family protein [Clostridia bacterium]
MLADKIGCPMLTDTRLREINTGIFNGMGLEDFRLHPLRKDFSVMAYDEKYPEGESASGFFDRIKEVLIDIHAKYKGKRVLIVTHEGVINVALCLVRGWKYSNMVSLWIPYANSVELM